LILIITDLTCVETDYRMKMALGEDSLKLHACLTGAFQVLGSFWLQRARRLC
jgi:hypothetical protein